MGVDYIYSLYLQGLSFFTNPCIYTRRFLQETALEQWWPVWGSITFIHCIYKACPSLRTLVFTLDGFYKKLPWNTERPCICQNAQNGQFASCLLSKQAFTPDVHRYIIETPKNLKLVLVTYLNFKAWTSREHAYIVLTPLNPTFI